MTQKLRAGTENSRSTISMWRADNQHLSFSESFSQMALQVDRALSVRVSKMVSRELSSSTEPSNSHII